jgi:hypothetical protein
MGSSSLLKSEFVNRLKSLNPDGLKMETLVEKNELIRQMNSFGKNYCQVIDIGLQYFNDNLPFGYTRRENILNVYPGSSLNDLNLIGSGLLNKDLDITLPAAKFFPGDTKLLENQAKDQILSVLNGTYNPDDLYAFNSYFGGNLTLGDLGLDKATNGVSRYGIWYAALYWNLGKTSLFHPVTTTSFIGEIETNTGIKCDGVCYGKANCKFADNYVGDTSLGCAGGSTWAAYITWAWYFKKNLDGNMELLYMNQTTFWGEDTIFPSLLGPKPLSLMERPISSSDEKYLNKLKLFRTGNEWIVLDQVKGLKAFDSLLQDTYVIPFSENCPGTVALQTCLYNGNTEVPTILWPGNFLYPNSPQPDNQAILSNKDFQSYCINALAPMFYWEDIFGIDLTKVKNQEDYLATYVGNGTLRPNEDAIAAAAKLPSYATIRSQLYTSPTNNIFVKTWKQALLTKSGIETVAHQFGPIAGLQDFFNVNWVNHGVVVADLIGLEWQTNPTSVYIDAEGKTTLLDMYNIINSTYTPIFFPPHPQVGGYWEIAAEADKVYNAL